MGLDGLAELVRFVREGGTLLTEGSTTTILSDYGVLNSVRVEHPGTLYTKGSIMRGIIADHKSPIVYGYTADDLPVYFSAEPVLSAGGGGPGVGVGGIRSQQRRPRRWRGHHTELASRAALAVRRRRR